MQNIGIIDILKERGFIDKSGNVAPQGQKFLQQRVINSSQSVDNK